MHLVRHFVAFGMHAVREAVPLHAARRGQRRGRIGGRNQDGAVDPGPRNVHLGRDDQGTGEVKVSLRNLQDSASGGGEAIDRFLEISAIERHHADGPGLRLRPNLQRKRAAPAKFPAVAGVDPKLVLARLEPLGQHDSHTVLASLDRLEPDSRLTGLREIDERATEIGSLGKVAAEKGDCRPRLDGFSFAPPQIRGVDHKGSE